MTDRTDLYTEAFYTIILAEGSVNEVQNELFQVAQELQRNDELRNTLSDPHYPSAVRQQIVLDLLGGKATDTTLALISLVVTTGRVKDLSNIVDALLKRTATLASRSVAEVRSAVALSEDQKTRLAASIKQSQGLDVDVVSIVDPAVLGGIVVQIGDTVIDGSVRHRLGQLRESF
jgi:F-type H+-transporting ATPase subunit delta